MGQTKSKSHPAVSQQILASTTLRGLYASCEWDERSIRSLIIARRLAPIVVGVSDETRITNLTAIVPMNYEEECPICFLFYKGGLNRTTCCSKSMCTECFLQVRPPTRRSVCPFCNSDTFHVNFRGPLSVDEIRREEKDRSALEAHEQRILTEARKSSSARQLSPHDLGISPADVALVSPLGTPAAGAVVNDECSADTTDDDANRVPLDAAVVSGTPAVPSPLFERTATGPASDHDDSSASEESAVAQQQQFEQEPTFSINEAVRRTSNPSGGNANATDLASALNRFFGASMHVPESIDVSGMSLTQIDDAMLEEAIRMSLADSAPAAAAAATPAEQQRLVNRTASSASAPESAAESLESSLESPRSALQSLPIAMLGSSSSSSAAPRAKHSSKAAAAAASSSHARLHNNQSGGAAPRVRPSHARSASTSSRSDEYESDSLDPANRNSSLTTSLPCSASTSCADTSDPDDDTPSVPAVRSSARRRRKGGLNAASSSSNSSSSVSLIHSNSGHRTSLPALTKVVTFHDAQDEAQDEEI